MTKYLLTVLLISSINSLFALNITWTNGSADGKWGTAANWDSGTVPGSTDIAIFNNSSITNCSILSNISVEGIDIQAGYTGTITQNNGFTITVDTSDFKIADGNFIGGNSIIDINGDLIISGGVFTATTADVKLSGDFTFSGGTFNHNNGTFRFDGLAQTTTGTISFYNVTLLKAWGGGDQTHTNDVTINNTYSVLGGQTTRLNGPGITNCLGDIILSNNAYYGGGGTGTVKITGVANQLISHTVSFGRCALPNVIIDKAAGTATFNGIVPATGDWTYTTGTLDYLTNNATIAFVGKGQNINGAQDFRNLTIRIAWGGGTINFMDDVNITNTLNINGSQTTHINGPGLINCKKDININCTAYSMWGNATIFINGTGNQNITSTVGIRRGALPYVNINKPSGTAFFSGIITAHRDWTYTAGNVDYTTNNSTIAFNANGQKVIGTEVGANGFNNVSIWMSWGGGKIDFMNDIDVHGTFSILANQNTELNGPGIIHCKGDIDLPGTMDGNTGLGTIKIDGTGAQTITGNAVVGRCEIPYVIIDKPSGTATFFNTVSVIRDWTYMTGNVDYTTNDATIAFTRAAQTVYGVQNFNNVTVSLQWTSFWGVNDNINVNGTFTLQGNAKTALNGPGIVNSIGDINLNNTYWNGCDGDGTFNISGNTNQNIVSTRPIVQSSLPNVIINKTGGTAIFSGIVSVTKDWTYTAGNVDHTTNNSTIAFTGSNQNVNGLQDFNNVTVSLKWASFWAVNNDINVNGIFTLQGKQKTTLNGPGIVNSIGDINLNNIYWNGCNGDGTINISGNTNQNIVSTRPIVQSSLPNVIINKTGGTAIFSGIVSVTKDWTYTAGNVDYATNDATIAFTGITNQNVNGLQTGTESFNKLTLSHQGSTNWIVNDDININSDFTNGGGQKTRINGPAIVHCYGDINLLNNAYDGGIGSTGTVRITGTANQNIVSNTILSRGMLPNIIIDKSGGTATFTGIINFVKDFTYVGGNVDALTNQSKFQSYGNNALIDGESTIGTELMFYDFNFNPNSITNQTLTGNLNVSNNLYLGSARVNMNGNEVTLNNQLGSALTSAYYGLLKSEQTDNSSKINWNIGTNADDHIYIFGNTGNNKIPFHFQVTDGGDVGVVSVSTYHTNSANVPYPTSPIAVTNLVSGSNPDNSTNVIDRFWQIDKSGIAGTATMKFTYAQGDVSGGVWGNEPALEAQRYQSSDNKWQPALPGQTMNSGARSVEVPNVSTFSPWTLALNTNPLPIELISFTATKNENVVDLKWVTASEINNDYFTVERSSDGINFEPILTQNGAGNSSSILNYSDVDRNPINGVSYYRLKQTDYDGKYEYSDVISISFSNENEFLIYPNPSNGNFYISNNDSNGQLTVYDASGKIVYSKNITNTTEAIELQNVSPGLYVVEFKSSTNIKKASIIIR